MSKAEKKPQRQIVVLGGGGFSMEPRNLRLDRYLLGLSPKAKPKVCFVPTASGDSPHYIRRFYRAMQKHSCRPSVLSLFQRSVRDLEAHVLDQDIVYVGGGNTANLLEVWRLHGLDRALRKVYQKGVVLCGISAGMNCWFESSVTDSFGSLRELRDGLGLLPGSACPHYDGEAQRRPTFRRLIRQKVLPAGIAAEDGAAIHYVNGRIHRCVSSRPQAKVYRVALRSGRVLHEPLSVQFL